MNVYDLILINLILSNLILINMTACNRQTASARLSFLPYLEVPRHALLRTLCYRHIHEHRCR